MLAGERAVLAHASGHENFTKLMEFGEFLFGLLKGGPGDGVSSENITKIHECR